MDSTCIARGSHFATRTDRQQIDVFAEAESIQEGPAQRRPSEEDERLRMLRDRVQDVRDDEVVLDLVSGHAEAIIARSSFSTECWPMRGLFPVDGVGRRAG